MEKLKLKRKVNVFHARFQIDSGMGAVSVNVNLFLNKVMQLCEVEIQH